MAVDRVWIPTVGALLAVAGGVAVNRVGGSVRSQLIWFFVAFLLMLAAGLVQLKSNARDHELKLLAVDAKGGPPLLGDVTLGDLGVHWPHVREDGYGPYVIRDVDAALDEVVQSDQALVIVSGAALAGCTRTLAEAALRYEEKSLLLWFEDIPRARLSDLIAAACRQARGRPAVLRLENPELELLSQVSAGLLRDLAPGLRIFMSIDAGLVNAGVLPADAVALLSAPDVSVELGLISATERERLASIPAYHAISRAYDDQPVLIGRLMTSLGPLIEALQIRDEDAVCRVAVLHAAVDWQRAGVPQLLT